MGHFVEWHWQPRSPDDDFWLTTLSRYRHKGDFQRSPLNSSRPRLSADQATDVSLCGLKQIDAVKISPPPIGDGRRERVEEWKTQGVKPFSWRTYCCVPKRCNWEFCWFLCVNNIDVIAAQLCWATQYSSSESIWKKDKKTVFFLDVSVQNVSKPVQRFQILNSRFNLSNGTVAMEENFPAILPRVEVYLPRVWMVNHKPCISPLETYPFVKAGDACAHSGCQRQDWKIL